jgi:hypothetical protein
VGHRRSGYREWHGSSCAPGFAHDRRTRRVAPIARLEAQIGLRKLVERLPHLRLTGETERIDSWMYWGRRRLPVAWG